MDNIRESNSSFQRSTARAVQKKIHGWVPAAIIATIGNLSYAAFPNPSVGVYL
jgi:hypothetical protein